MTTDRVGRSVVVRANGVDLNTTTAQPDSLVIDLTGIRFLFDIAPSLADVKRSQVRLVKRRRPTGRRKELSG
ncbi:MAG TPA: hypothetical protein VGL80_16930 [Pseudonocardiaceae bacterium]